MADQSERRQIAWLIELKPSVCTVPTYWCGGDEPWTTDHNRAVRFCRSQDAKAVIDDYSWSEADAIEHIWAPARITNKPTCEYCGATDGLRESCPAFAGHPASNVCAECFIGKDDGPYFDNLPLAADAILTAHPDDEAIQQACIAYNGVLLNQPEDERNQHVAMRAALAVVRSRACAGEMREALASHDCCGAAADHLEAQAATISALRVELEAARRFVEMVAGLDEHLSGAVGDNDKYVVLLSITAGDVRRARALSIAGKPAEKEPSNGTD